MAALEVEKPGGSPNEVALGVRLPGSVCGEPPLQPRPRGGVPSRRNGQRPASSRTHFWHYHMSQGNVWPQTDFISWSLDRKPLSLFPSFAWCQKKKKMSHAELSFVKKFWQEVPNWDWSWFLRKGPHTNSNTDLLCDRDHRLGPQFSHPWILMCFLPL